MAIPGSEAGAVPAEWMAAIDSQVRHLSDRTAEDRIEARERFAKIEERVGALATSQTSVETTVKHIDKTISTWSKVIAAVVTAAVIAITGAFWHAGGRTP